MIAIVAGLALLRYGWVWVSLRLTILRRAPGTVRTGPAWRLVRLNALAGNWTRYLSLNATASF